MLLLVRHVICASDIYKLLSQKSLFNTLLYGRLLNLYILPRAATHSKHTVALPAHYFVTTPIYYLNSVPHLGHLYTTVLADTISRWYRVLQVPVAFSTGTDEHGLKVLQAANVAGKPVASFCDTMSSEFKRLFDSADVSYTDFIRTTEPRHKATVYALWKRLEDRGFLYRGSYEGWYSVSDEAFLSDADVKDVTNSKGETMKVAADSGHRVEWTTEDNYKFRLSQFTEPLTRWLDSNVIEPQCFEPIVRQFIAGGLADLSVSRPRIRIPWGIPVPGDDSQTVYVWLDALANYLTVAGYPQELRHWPADCQVIGKDILKFHTIYWPAFLMAAGLEPPRRILVHSHWLMNKEKMSKSKGNVVDPFDRIQRYTVDGLRYYLLKDGTPHSDGNYTDQRAVECLNSDLCNTMGNLLSRCTGLSLNSNQVFPKFCQTTFDRYASEDDRQMWTDLQSLPYTVDTHYRQFTIHRGLDAVCCQLYKANAFVQHRKPWELISNNKAVAIGTNSLAKSTTDPSSSDQLNFVLNVAMETLRVSALLLQPAVPTLAQRILDRLGIPPAERYWRHLVAGPSNVDRPLGQDMGVLFARIKQ